MSVWLSVCMYISYITLYKSRFPRHLRPWSAFRPHHGAVVTRRLGPPCALSQGRCSTPWADTTNGGGTWRIIPWIVTGCNWFHNISDCICTYTYDI